MCKTAKTIGVFTITTRKTHNEKEIIQKESFAIKCGRENFDAQASKYSKSLRLFTCYNLEKLVCQRNSENCKNSFRDRNQMV